MKILRWLDAHFEEVLLAILLIVIACVSFLQVVIRKVPFIPALTWAEEFCRFCWVCYFKSSFNKCTFCKLTLYLCTLSQLK